MTFKHEFRIYEFSSRRFPRGIHRFSCEATQRHKKYVAVASLRFGIVDRLTGVIKFAAVIMMNSVSRFRFCSILWRRSFRGGPLCSEAANKLDVSEAPYMTDVHTLRMSHVTRDWIGSPSSDTLSTSSNFMKARFILSMSPSV